MNNICKKCGQEMILANVRRNSLIPAGQYFMCENCHKLYPVADIKK